MRTELALNLIPERAKELRWNEVEIHFRHIKSPVGNLIYEAGSDLWILIEEDDLRFDSGTYRFPGTGVRIESPNGIFDLIDTKVAEQEHEHSGKISITNRTSRILFVKFLQITPKRKLKNGKKN
jgi:hypothetical protein